MKRKWYWYLGLTILIYMFTIGLFQFWFRLPLMIAKDPFYGSGYAIGCIGITALSIWLIRKGGRHARQ